jgi:acetylornithine deacetylase/succinyl-diaminopimelate desuccinylase-like protein
MEFNLVYFLDEAMAAEEAGHGRSAALLRGDMERQIDRAADGDAFLASQRPRVTWIKDLPPFETPVDSTLLSAVCRAHEEITGVPAPVDTINGWSDATYVPLVAGCEVVNLGCAALGAAHSPTEYVEEETLLRVTKTLALYLARTLRESDD